MNYQASSLFSTPWHGTVVCWWLIVGDSRRGISSALAAEYHASGERQIVLGTYEEARAIVPAAEKVGAA